MKILLIILAIIAGIVLIPFIAFIILISIAESKEMEENVKNGAIDGRYLSRIDDDDDKTYYLCDESGEIRMTINGKKSADRYAYLMREIQGIHITDIRCEDTQNGEGVEV